MDITEYLNRKKELAAFVSDNGSKIVKDYIQNFMTQYPQVHAIRWHQYTPYFNDGEACVFSVSSPYFLRREPTQQDLEVSTWDSDWEDGANDPTGKAFDEFSGHLCGDLEDLLLSVFGDHQEICIYRKDGKIVMDVNDFEHD